MTRNNYAAKSVRKDRGILLDTQYSHASVSNVRRISSGRYGGIHRLGRPYLFICYWNSRVIRAKRRLRFMIMNSAISFEFSSSSSSSISLDVSAVQFP